MSFVWYLARIEHKRKRVIDEVSRRENLKKTKFRAQLFEHLRRHNDNLAEIREHELRCMQDSQLHADFSEELLHEFETIEAAPAQLVHLPIGASEAQIEMARTKIWSKISTQLVPRVFRMRLMTQSNAINNASIVAQLCQRELRKRDTSRINFKESMCISVSKKMNREMAVFWKRNEKDEREARKRAEKEMTESLKREEEQREKRRQARKLNFLITQTELFSHFIGNKIEQLNENPEITAGKTQRFSEIDFDSVDDKYLDEMARQQAQNALEKQKKYVSGFDQAATSPVSGVVEVSPPNILRCKLKPYQLKGLNWLANLYEQGINGILADDMGLGKTVQSISLLAWLAESHNVWGPFLVVSPASTLHNWQQEFAKFCPSLKVLPYWGNLNERKTLRKFWAAARKPCRKESPWHVLITSYQFVVSDQKYFQKVRWQYMLLDEAHAIKSSSTARWKTLLNFKCRNRLLLTGTPIQNSMQELWALLHFIMPTMFDSHEEFSEWFSKDIESHASDKGKLNERQLNRLHMILKPFMLRRVKSEVQHEIGSKIEKTVYCELSARQKRMYSALADRISVDDLLDRAIFTDQTGTRGVSDNALLNAVMQLRKVCNHPQIFEPAEVVSPFTFAECASAPLSTDEVALLVLFNSRNPINYRQPRLLSELPHHRSKAFLDIWDPSHCLHSDGFSFANLSPYSLGDFSDISGSNLLNRVQIYCRMRDGGMIESEECNNPITAALQVEFFYDFLRNSPFLAAYSPKAVSPPVELDEGEVLQIFDNQLDKFDGVDFRSYNQSRIFIPTAEQLIFDCGKLGALDNLLEQLKLDNHRVLLYFQMTKMIDLMEDYLVYRKYSYLRLDGSVSISARRDLVGEWQSKDDIFIFLLSTRAGGLGINLTAADTVIFYDSDWNPTVDQQAMDRSHRLGQTKQVTVYRLVTRGTIEERILQRATEKNAVQQVVIAEGAFDSK